MERFVRLYIVRLLAAVALVTAGLAVTSGTAPAQHAPCNPSIQTCL